MSLKSTETVAFRLDPAATKRLTEAGRERGMTKGEFARYLVLQGLAGEMTRVLDRLEKVREEVRNYEERSAGDAAALRRLLRVAVGGLLMELGQIEEERAVAWLDEFMPD